MNEADVKQYINKIYNGGRGSGNPNPGQGRGKGKPGAGAGAGMKTRDIKGKTRSEKIASVKQGDTVEIEPIDTLPNFDKKIKVDKVGDDYFRYGITEYSDGKDYPFYAIKDIKKISYNFDHDISDIPQKLLEGFTGTSSRYNDPGKMSVELTPKGNLHLMYDGKDVVTLGMENFSKKDIEKLVELGLLK